MCGFDPCDGKEGRVFKDRRLCTTDAHHLNEVDIDICHLLGALVWEIDFLGVLGLAQGCVYCPVFAVY